MTTITNVSWRPGGPAPQMGRPCKCYYTGCNASFPDHQSLSDHIFTVHGDSLAALDAKQVLAEAEAILAGHKPAGTVQHG